MRKIFFAALVTLAVHVRVAAQTAPGNCAKVQALITDLRQNDLKHSRGPKTLPGTYISNVTLDGFVTTTIDNGTFSFDFIARTAPTADKATAAKTYHALVDQMKTCLKTIGYTSQDNSNEYVQETLFTKGEDVVRVHISLQETGDEYDVFLNLKKEKPLEN